MIRGESSDEINYPGVEATGGYIENDAPLPKRILISIVIRNLSGTSYATIQSRIQTVVSTYIDSLPIGAPVIFSEIVTQVQGVNGIQTVAISSPLYDGSHDLIVLQPNEQAIVVNPLTDITISLQA